MKRKVESMAFILIIILCIGLYFYYYPPTKPEETVDINKILYNPNEYNNPTYLKTLSDGQKTQLIDSFDNLLYENCKDEKLNEDCSPYFVYSYLKTKFILGQSGYTSKNPEKDYDIIDNKIRKIYLNSLDSSILTEDDLKGFVVPLLAEMCTIGFSNGTYVSYVYWFPEQTRIYWMQKLLDINKTNWQSTDMQIYYSINCLGALTVNDLSRRSGIDQDELNNRICNILPTFSNINQEDLCEIFDYLKIKRFCLINITADERTLVENLLSKDYESNYQKGCKEKLSGLYNLI